MGTIGEAARRAEIAHDGMLGHAERRLDGRADPEPLVSSRASGDAGHAPGCARDHTLAAASVAVPPGVARLRKAAAALSSSEWIHGDDCAHRLCTSDCEDGDECVAADHGWVASVEELLAAAWAAGPVPTLPDADLARVIAAWPALDKWDRESIISDAEKWARMSWRYVARALLVGGDVSRLSLDFDRDGALLVTACDVDGEPATAEQGAPVADGVGV